MAQIDFLIKRTCVFFVERLNGVLMVRTRGNSGPCGKEGKGQEEEQATAPPAKKAAAAPPPPSKVRGEKCGGSADVRFVDGLGVCIPKAKALQPSTVGRQPEVAH
jgi:hypothetical protein